MGADDDVDRAVGEPFAWSPSPRPAGTSRDRRPILIGKPWKRSTKFRVMLAREQGGRRRPARPACPAIAATKAARSATSVLPKPTSPQTSRSIGLPAAEIAEHVVDRAVLVVGLLIGEAVDEGGIAACRARATGAGRSARSAAVAISSPAISRMRSFIRALRRCQASPPSRSSATPSLVAAVAGEDVDILDRHVELVAAGIVERDAIVRRLADRDLGQPFVAADAVIDMDDEIAGVSVASSARKASALLRRLRAADQPVAEHVLLGEQRDSGVGEAVIERQHQQRRRALRAPSASCQLSASVERWSGRDRRAARQPLARADANSWRGRPSAPPCAQRCEMLGHRFVDVGAAARAPARNRAAASTPKSMTVRALRLVEGVARWIGRAGDRVVPFARASDRASSGSSGR